MDTAVEAVNPAGRSKEEDCEIVGEMEDEMEVKDPSDTLICWDWWGRRAMSKEGFYGVAKDVEDTDVI
jgi:hypothetical protein